VGNGLADLMRPLGRTSALSLVRQGGLSVDLLADGGLLLLQRSSRREENWSESDDHPSGRRFAFPNFNRAPENLLARLAKQHSIVTCISQMATIYSKDTEVNDLRNRYTPTKSATQKMVNIESLPRLRALTTPFTLYFVRARDETLHLCTAQVLRRSNLS